MKTQRIVIVLIGSIASLSIAALSNTALSNTALAQTPPNLSQADIDEAVRRGTVATLAHICGLRDEAWAFDLDATHAARPDDETLRQAPGNQLITTAMTYAETEALEDFAESAPAVTCEPMKRNPELARADKIVHDFRFLKNRTKPTS